MVEYGSIAAAMAILVSSLGGMLGSAASLPVTDGKSIALVTTAARTHHVQGASAREAYAKAPYRRPAIRYLYAIGWIGAASDRAACQTALVFGEDPKRAAAKLLRHSPKLLARLRRVHVTASQASTAIGRGFVDGCG